MYFPDCGLNGTIGSDGNITAKLVSYVNIEQMAVGKSIHIPPAIWDVVVNVLKYLSKAIDAGSFQWKELMWHTLELVGSPHRGSADVHTCHLCFQSCSEAIQFY